MTAQRYTEKANQKLATTRSQRGLPGIDFRAHGSLAVDRASDEQRNERMEVGDEGRLGGAGCPGLAGWWRRISIS